MLKVEFSKEANIEYLEIWNWLRLVVEPKYKYKIVYSIKKDYIYILSIFKYKNLWE